MDRLNRYFSDNDTCNVSYDSKNVNVDNVQQKQKIRHSTNRQNKNTGPSREMMFKIDTGAGANLISVDDYSKVNPSDIDESGNSLAGCSHNRTTLKAYGGRTIKQYGVRVINCYWENFLYNQSPKLHRPRDPYC